MHQVSFVKASCVKVSCGKVSCGKVSYGKVSCGKVSCGKVSCGKVSCGKLCLIYNAKASIGWQHLAEQTYSKLPVHHETTLRCWRYTTGSALGF